MTQITRCVRVAHHEDYSHESSRERSHLARITGETQTNSHGYLLRNAEFRGFYARIIAEHLKLGGES